MKVIFAGTPEFARVALEKIHQAGHDIALVLTQPDRPAGRGMKLQASAVKQYALAHALSVSQPRSLRLDGKFPDDAAQARQAIEAAQADVMVVAAYGLILPQWVLDAMERPGKHGCINIHGSLLPRWRGAAPIHRAIEAGDAETGVTIMQMDAGLDTGDMLLRQSLAIEPSDTTASLHDKVAALGADMVVRALAQAGTWIRVKQPSTGVTYAHKVEKQEAAIDWTQDAATIVRKVRAFDPFPCATAQMDTEVIKVWAAQHDPGQLPPVGATPGQILALSREGIVVAAMNSVATLVELQRAGGKRLGAAEFLRGFPLEVGMCFSPHQVGT
ncbi:methionyl-tRNA formyltransferase [Curvibacter sp. APW13]|uniref:methionyl-tRNA formyltransferase n=1 Tax=Curvibacter sp. APW13 TaxID=3077236 RepID=UPI0028E04C0D|nr:methionyl-tRNA formyltransferase [Curvibacter sp. APW13]MDT8990112.1 methionyl-tRNA formyltransferase [Curvibacter sp. APW13]